MSLETLSVVHFSTADNVGGSGQAAYRIHRGLRRLGHRSRMLVGEKVTQDPDVETVYLGRAGRMKDRLADIVTGRLGLQYVYLPSSRRVKRHPWVQEADILQLYNTHGGYFSQFLLPSLSRRAPIVWRLSDAWPMTGHCSYPRDCERWKSGCGRCPYLRTYPSLPFDTTALLWKLKRYLYKRSDVTVVAPSSWMERMAKESPLLERFTIRRIPTGIDTGIYRPHAKRDMRDLFDIPSEARVILFAAHVLDGNERKGGEFLIEALRKLGRMEKTILLLAGIGGGSWIDKVSIEVRLLGYIHDPRLMAAVYSAADIVVVPSEVENLPNVVLESMATGTPPVAFDVGGMADAVEHMKTGYLARYADIDDLAEGIRLLLESESLRTTLAEEGRRLVEREFNMTLQAARFSELYLEILSRRRAENFAEKPEPFALTR